MIPLKSIFFDISMNTLTYFNIQYTIPFLSKNVDYFSKNNCECYNIYWQKYPGRVHCMQLIQPI